MYSRSIASKLLSVIINSYLVSVLPIVGCTTPENEYYMIYGATDCSFGYIINACGICIICVAKGAVELKAFSETWMIMLVLKNCGYCLDTRFSY